MIASNIGGLPDIIRDNEDGILVEPGDVDALREALARVLADPALRSTCAIRSRQVVSGFARRSASARWKVSAP